MPVVLGINAIPLPGAPGELWYNVAPQSVVPFALDSERKGLIHESIAH